MKRVISPITAVSLSAFALALSGCGIIERVSDRIEAATVDGPVEVEKAPFPRHDDEDAYVFNDLPIRLYFHSQTPPPQTEVLGPVRVIFSLRTDAHSCREAGIKGLQKLQRVAVNRRVQAVVNIRATWKGKNIGDDIHFGCAKVGGKYQIVWEGALADIPEPPPEELPDEPSPDLDEAVEPDDISTAGKIRKLQQLYYQGLISREEYEQRKAKLLDEI